MPKCFVCENEKFINIFKINGLKVFSSLKTFPFFEEKAFDALLWKCEKCGFVQQIISDNLKFFLSNFYKDDNSFITPPPSQSDFGDKTVDYEVAFIKKYLTLTVKNILEIGCHDGYFLSRLKEKFDANAVGIEISKQKSCSNKIKIIQDYYPTTKLNNEKFDLVILRSVLEHIFDPNFFIKSLKNNLKNNGAILIKVPEESESFRRGMISYQHQHISYFTFNTLKILMNNMGFEILAWEINPRGLLCLCQNSDFVPSPEWKTDEAANNFVEKEKELINRFDRLLGASDTRIGLYGACNFTHNILHILRRFDNIYLFDSDSKRQNRYMSGVNNPVQSWEKIESSKLDKLIIMPMTFTEEIYNFLLSLNIKTPIIKLFDYEQLPCK